MAVYLAIMTITDIKFSFLAGSITESTAYALLRGSGVFKEEAETIVSCWLDEARDRCLDITISGWREHDAS